jgi:lysophospholipase L1-like esterase
MLGTNDYSDPDATAAGTAAQLKQIVDEIHAVNADVEIFVAIIPRTNKEMADYDAALQTMPDVTYVDQFSGFDPETMTDDGVHPNDIGSQLIADVYYAALQSAGYCP